MILFGCVENCINKSNNKFKNNSLPTNVVAFDLINSCYLQFYLSQLQFIKGIEL